MAFTAPSITASGLTFAQLQSGGPAAHLESLITANTGPTTAPTAAPTLSESGSGGTLPAATYYVVITETNGIGETTASPVSSGQAITLGQDLVITYPSLQSGNTARNAYVGTSNTGPFTLAVTGATGSTSTITAPLPSNSFAVNPPTANTTGLSTLQLQLLRYAKSGDLQKVWDFLHLTVTNFCKGRPVAFNQSQKKLSDVAVVFAILNKMCSEAGTLVDANPGHFTSSATPIGSSETARVWP